MAHSEKLSDIIGLEKCEVKPQKGQYNFCISFNLSQKRAITKLKICKWPLISNWQFSQNLSQKGQQLSQHFADYPPYQTWPVFYDAWLFCKD